MMALRIVRRWSWVTAVVGVGLLQGCFTTGDDDDSGSSSGCSKDSDCKNGRICENKTCVDDNGSVLGGSSGTTIGTGGSSTAAKGGTGGTASGKGGTSATQGGSGGTGGSTPANGGSASGSGGSGGSASGAGGSSGTSGTCSVDDPATCPTTDSMTYCKDGTVVTETCDSFCTSFGFPPLPCTAPAGCDCDVNNPTDATCEAATNIVCNCLDGTTTPCVTSPDPNDPNSLAFYPPYIYASCFSGSEADQTFFHCLYMQSQLDPVPSCKDGFAACGVDTSSAGAAGM